MVSVTTSTSAAEHLALVLTTARERGSTWPCMDNDAWTAEDAETRAAAARACRPCPVSSLCAAAAREDPPTFGVWAGVDFADRDARRAALRAGAA